MIRFAIEKDIPKIIDLLKQVCLVHHNGRPDIFKVGTKYSTEELKAILKDDIRPILVSVDDSILDAKGKIDLTKFKPICYDTDGHGYYTLGEKVGQAFFDGLKLK